MANAQRTKGQDVSLVVVVDGQPQAGSFAKVESFNWKPLDEIQTTDFLGESESDFDIQHDGYEVNFTIEELENLAVDNVLLPLVKSLKDGNTMPSVTLVFVKRFRDPALPIKTLEFQNVKLILNSQEAGSRKDFVKSSFTGRCKTMESI